MAQHHPGVSRPARASTPTPIHAPTTAATEAEEAGTVEADLYSLGMVLYEDATGRDRLEFPAMPSRLAEHPDLVATELGNHASARCALQEPELQQVRLVDILDRLGLFAHADRERGEPNWSTAELIADRP